MITIPALAVALLQASGEAQPTQKQIASLATSLRAKLRSLVAAGEIQETDLASVGGTYVLTAAQVKLLATDRRAGNPGRPRKQ